VGELVGDSLLVAGVAHDAHGAADTEPFVGFQAGEVLIAAEPFDVMALVVAVGRHVRRGAGFAKRGVQKPTPQFSEKAHSMFPSCVLQRFALKNCFKRFI
jgi:hypothetical protein